MVIQKETLGQKATWYFLLPGYLPLCISCINNTVSQVENTLESLRWCFTDQRASLPVLLVEQSQ